MATTKNHPTSRSHGNCPALMMNGRNHSTINAHNFHTEFATTNGIADVRSAARAVANPIRILSTKSATVADPTLREGVVDANRILIHGAPTPDENTTRETDRDGRRALANR